MRNPEHLLRTEMRLRLPRGRVFDFFCAAENLARITPPELDFRIVSPGPVTLRQGAIILYRLSLWGIPFRWRTEITGWRPPHEFVDTQREGPYDMWVHRHTFRRDGADTIIADEVRYRLPVPILGELAFPLVRLHLARIFRYRQRQVRRLLVGPNGL